jgi:hypothetical protein
MDFASFYDFLIRVWNSFDDVVFFVFIILLVYVFPFHDFNFRKKKYHTHFSSKTQKSQTLYLRH